MELKMVNHEGAGSIACPPEVQQRLLTVEPPPDDSDRKQVCYLGTMSRTLFSMKTQNLGIILKFKLWVQRLSLWPEVLHFQNEFRVPMAQVSGTRLMSCGRHGKDPVFPPWCLHSLHKGPRHLNIKSPDCGTEPCNSDKRKACSRVRMSLNLPTRCPSKWNWERRFIVRQGVQHSQSRVI